MVVNAKITSAEMTTRAIIKFRLSLDIRALLLVFISAYTKVLE